MAVPKFPKSLEKVFMGKEPTSCPHILTDSSDGWLTRAYSWYNYFYSIPELRPWIEEWMMKEGWSDRRIRNFQRLSDHVLSNSIGGTARMLLNGIHLPDDLVKRFIYKLESLTKDDEIIIEKTPPSKNPHTNYIAWIDEQFDKREVPDIARYARDNSLTQGNMKAIIDHTKPLVEEIELVLNKSDPDLVEGYRNWRTNDLRKFHDNLVKMLGVLDIGTKSKPRIIKDKKGMAKKKVIPKEKQASSMLYNEHGILELGIRGHKPISVIGAQQVWLYNPKYKALDVINSLDEKGFGIKGTGLTNMDHTRSFGKKLKKQEQLLEFMGKSKNGLMKFFDDLTTKQNNTNGRTTRDVVILKVFP